MPLLRDQPDDLDALIGAAAQARGLDANFVEKDFWLTEILRAATVPFDVVGKGGGSHPVRTVFKGGTSLSRAYGLIERFSEDVDLLVGFPDVELSTDVKDKALKRIRDEVARHLRLDGTAIQAEAATTGVKRNVRYHYPTSRPHTHGLMSEGVLLEMGSRGGTHPTQTHTFRSMAAEYAIGDLGDSPGEWDEFAPITVEVLAPERTLFEKLALLHDGVTRFPDPDARDRLLKAGRHLYDVHRLLGDDAVVGALGALGGEGVAALCADIDEHSGQARFSFTPRPGEGYGRGPLVDLSPECQAVLEASYTSAMSMVYGERPAFGECLETVRRHAALL